MHNGICPFLLNRYTVKHLLTFINTISNITMHLFLSGLVAMTEKRLKHSKTHTWVMCPTCRQHTDYRNIAYAVDAQKESPNSSMLHTIDNCEKHEASITVEGSYGTKVFYRIILL